MEVLHDHQWVEVSSQLVLRSCGWTASLFHVVLVQMQSGLVRSVVALVQHRTAMAILPDLCDREVNVGFASGEGLQEQSLEEVLVNLLCFGAKRSCVGCLQLRLSVARELVKDVCRLPYRLACSVHSLTRRCP